MGKNGFHAQPIITQVAPATNKQATFSNCDRSLRNQCPVNTPNNVVEIAGIVLRMPSGSYTLPCFQTCGPNTTRSTYEARLPSFVKSPAAKPGAAIWVITSQ